MFISFGWTAQLQLSNLALPQQVVNLIRNATQKLRIEAWRATCSGQEFSFGGAEVRDGSVRFELRTPHWNDCSSSYTPPTILNKKSNKPPLRVQP